MRLDDSGNKIEGNYDVDLTWFSNPLTIDESSEFVEIPLVVTPEFPMSALLVLPLSLIVIILFSKFSKHNKI